MEPQAALLPVLDTPTGITVNAHTRLNTDWASIKALVESGVPIPHLAKEFKITRQAIQFRCKQEQWLSPHKVESLRKEIAAKQLKAFKQSGKVTDINELKASIWVERQETVKERTFNIVEQALEGVTPEKAAKMIQNPLGLMHITTVARLITGEEKADADSKPGMAINIGFLRSQRPTDVIEAEVVTE